MSTNNIQLVEELKDLRKELEGVDLISYLALAGWTYCLEEPENELGLNLDLIEPIATDKSYLRIMSTYILREEAKKIDWSLMEDIIKNSIDDVYSSFKKLKKKNLNKKNKKWVDKYTDKLIAKISNLSYNGTSVTILDYVRKNVLLLVDDYMKKAIEKNAYQKLEFLKNRINDSISHKIARM
jgi:hypothetical protein